MIIVSGLSGAGKTVALHSLEDLGYYCIDNLPVNLLSALYEEQKNISQPVAVGIDVRSHNDGTDNIAEAIQRLKNQPTTTKILFLTASKAILVKRYSESRRKHPLTTDSMPLQEAIERESRLLAPLITGSDYKIDTSKTSIYDLKARIAQWLALNNAEQTTITLESFGFKHGVPIDADLMFDVRFLPNPYWEAELRQFTGKDPQIKTYLGQFDECERFVADTTAYLSRWLPTYLKSYRNYLTVAIGCTGGKHRSVYSCEQIAERLQPQFGEIHLRHRDLPNK